jgi:hypothetical protein
LTSDARDSNGAIEAHAINAFNFLVEIAGAAASTEIGPDRSLISYVLPDVFIEIELDWQESAAFALVGQPVDGSRPDGYYVDSAGRKVRWHLGAALEEGEHAARASRLKRLVRESGPAAMLDEIDAYAAEVRELLPSLGALVRQLRSE